MTQILEKYSLLEVEVYKLKKNGIKSRECEKMRCEILNLKKENF